MDRRIFCGLLPVSAVALALAPQAGFAAPDSVRMEPAPIDLPAATVARARSLLTALQAGIIDRSEFDPQMNAMLTDDTLKSGAGFIRPYGEPLAFTPVQLQTTADGTAALFRVRFATDTLTWVVRVGPAGTINGFALRHSPRNQVYSVFAHLIEGY